MDKKGQRRAVNEKKVANKSQEYQLVQSGIYYGHNVNMLMLRNPFISISQDLYSQQYAPCEKAYSHDQIYLNTPKYNQNPTYSNFRGEVFADTCNRHLFHKESTSDKDEFKSIGKKRASPVYIDQKNKRNVTFSKRKKGLIKKAYELSLLTGSQVLLLVASDSGHVYTFTTSKLRPIITEHEKLIREYLNPLITKVSNGQGGGFQECSGEDDKSSRC